MSRFIKVLWPNYISSSSPIMRAGKALTLIFQSLTGIFLKNYQDPKCRAKERFWKKTDVLRNLKKKKKAECLYRSRNISKYIVHFWMSFNFWKYVPRESWSSEKNLIYSNLFCSCNRSTNGNNSTKRSTLKPFSTLITEELMLIESWFVRPLWKRTPPSII